VAGVPIMRSPVQILFLILVTDLPPSIALGMEPGEKNILKQRPRPKSEPVVLSWMWFNMFLNGLVLSVVVIAVYLFALMHYCDTIFQEDIKADMNNYLQMARTVAFISLVFCENVRSYTSRSFDQPVWRNFCGNMEMHKAIVVAQLALWVAVLIPWFSDKILGLRGLEIGGWGYLMALAGPAATLILCELIKVVTAFQMRMYQQRLAKAMQAQDDEVAKSVTKSHVLANSPVQLAHVVDAVAGSADNVTRVVSGGVRDIIRGESYNKLGDTERGISSI